MTGETSGALRHRLTLEAPVRTEEEGGAASVAWTTVADVFAAITPGSGRELVAADGTAARATHAILIRWRPGVLPAMRFSGAGRVFDIHAVLDRDERRHWLECLCEERLP